MMTYKFRRKFFLTAVFVCTLVTIYNVLLPGSNLHIRSRRRELGSEVRNRNITKKPYYSSSITRLMVDKLQKNKSSRYFSQSHDYLNAFVIELLSKGLPKNIELLENKTHLTYIPADRLRKGIEDLNEPYEIHDRTYPKELTAENRTSLMLRLNETFSSSTDGNKMTNDNDASPEEAAEVNEDLEDLDNEFDITELDDHINLKTEQRQEKQAPKENPEVKQLNQRSRFKWNGEYDIRINNTLEYRRQVYEAHVRPIKNIFGINCKALVEKNSEDEVTKAKAVMRQIPRRAISVDKYVRTLDCQNFRGGRGYIEHPLSQMELNFPLAFGITVYRDVEQAERLLRAIYRPHNFYCFHLDLKMSQKERTAFERISQCLDNVFISEISVNVTWGQFSVIQTELLCMKKLWQYKRWKYYINLTGQEFPLKTNREIVAILDSLSGANIVDGTWIRARERYFYRWTIAGEPPPHNIRPIKGSVHVAINRHFVDFALHDQRSSDFLEWLKKTEIPDETFFASLNHNPHLGINGSFLGEPEEYPLKPSLMRYKNWEIGHSVFVRSCAGKYVRNICVLGVGDLHKAYSDIGLFANKFNIDFEYLALDCLEEILYEKTWNQYLNDVTIDTTYFEHLDYVKRKLFVPPKK